ncbi:pre-mRNA-splicing factor Cwc21p [Monosporozyma servazzii]
MSYNGIGLKSAKGSSTSGHVQRSLASDNEKTSLLNYKARKQQQHKKDVKGRSDHRIKKFSPLNRDGNKDVVGVHHSLVKHLSKRDIELQVSELRDHLEDDRDDGKIEITNEDIDKKCNALREKLNKEAKEKERLSNLYKSRKQRTQEEEEEEEEES